MREVDLHDISLLNELIDGEHTTKMTGKTVKNFQLDRKINAIHRRLRFLESVGYVQRGFPIQNAVTYFITEEGIKFCRYASNS